MKNKNVSLVLSNEQSQILSQIHSDGDMVSLTDLWKQAGSSTTKRPVDWLGNEQTKGFVLALCKFQKVTENHLLKIKRGKNGGTYAQKQIALEYAQYLDPQLGVLVNEVFFQRVEEEKNPDLILDRAVKTYERRGMSPEWIRKRLKTKAVRNEFTSCLAAHGVEHEGFRNCTNAIYSPLYGGTTAVIREKKNLPDGANIRDNMSEFELQAIEFAEALSKNAIQKNGLKGNAQCELVCSKSARIVANAVLQAQK